MCGMPNCTVVPQVRIVQTEIPGTTKVKLTWCPDCDTRQCLLKDEQGEIVCRAQVLDPKAKRCPKGHMLDGR